MAVPFPPWNESDSIRETMLLLLDYPEQQAALREAGRVLYDLALESTTLEHGGTYNELQAVAAELRYISGFCAAMRREADESTMEPEERKLAMFAGRMAPRICALPDAAACR